MRLGLGHAGVENSMSPRPTSFSAPGWSRMTRLSIALATLKAMRLVMLALMMPVTTLASGRCVATTRWMPAARASCAMRTIESSTSLAATIMRSASSSMTMTRYGSSSAPSGPLPSWTIALYAPMLRAPALCSTLRRRSISETDQASALAASLGSVTTGT